VAVAAHVDWHAVDKGGEIGAVIEVEAAQKILVGLAGAGMLGGNQAGHVFRQLADARDRLGSEIGIADNAFRCCLGGPDLLQLATVDDDLLLFLESRPQAFVRRIGGGERSRGADGSK
jgi:hypothetical protein